MEERPRTIARWVDEFGPRALAFARTLSDSEEDARDLVQEAWLVVVEHRGRLPSDEMARPWVFEIVRKLGMSRIRRKKRRLGFRRRFSGDLPVPQPIDPPELDVDALVREVLTQIERLPGLQRRVLVARLIEGRTVAETARVLDRAEGTVKGSLARAVATLRQRMGGEWEEALKRAPLRGRSPPPGGGGAQDGNGEGDETRTDDEGEMK